MRVCGRCSRRRKRRLRRSSTRSPGFPVDSQPFEKKVIFNPRGASVRSFCKKLCLCPDFWYLIPALQGEREAEAPEVGRCLQTASHGALLQRGNGMRVLISLFCTWFATTAFS